VTCSAAILAQNLELVYWLLDRLDTPEPMHTSWKREAEKSLLGLAVEMAIEQQFENQST